VKAANFIQSEVLRDVRPSGLVAEFPVSPGQVADLLRLVDRGIISGKQAKEVYGLMRGTSAQPASIVRERNMTVLSDEGSLAALARQLLADNPKQADSYRAGKVNVLGFFVGQMMKQTSGSADPAVVNKVLRRALAGEADTAPPDSPAHTPENAGAPAGVTSNSAHVALPPNPSTRPSAQTALTPRSGPPDREDQSPLAQSVAPPAPTPPPLEHTTLTSASGVSAVVLPLPAMPAAETIPYDAFARVDVRVGRVLTAARVPVDTGDERGPRRIVAGLALSFSPEELLGKRVLVVCNLEPRDFGKGLVSEGMILAAGPSEGLALATVTEDVPPGTRVR
jgi:methionine--tRNA ligase beta chain